MGRLLKIILLLIAGFVGLLVIGAVALYLFFDPNDFREDIGQQVKNKTGRDLVIEGDLEVSVLPWLAVKMGASELGNAPGFDDQPFMRFEAAKLGVEFWPLLLQQRISVGKVQLDGLQVNMQVAADGSTNWEDLVEANQADAQTQDADSAAGRDLAIAGISVSDARVSYVDAEAGSSYGLSSLNLNTGKIAAGEAFDINAEFDFSISPQQYTGNAEFSATANLDSAAETLTLTGITTEALMSGLVEKPVAVTLRSDEIVAAFEADTLTVAPLALRFADLDIAADVAPMTISGVPRIQAKVKVDRFSAKALLEKLGMEVPVTADPDALSNIQLTADALMTEANLEFSNLNMSMDDSKIGGTLSMPRTGPTAYHFNLTMDTINADRYLEPVSEGSGGDAAQADDTPLPVDSIRDLIAKGNIKINEATMSGLQFTAVDLGIDVANDKLRLHPLTAQLFGGSYSGDIRVDASKATTRLSVNENVNGVQLAPLIKAMYNQDNVTGGLQGKFVLAGTGNTMGEVRQTLAGDLGFELSDGAFEGTDIWYQLRKARALFKKEAAPEPSLPPRTEFSSVTGTAKVADGVLNNNDFFAELPFMQLTGAGTVNLGGGTVDYAMNARVLERPEFAQGATAEELDEFTEAQIPFTITGPMTDPTVRPDIQGLLKAKVKSRIDDKKEDIKRRLLDRIGLSQEQPPGKEQVPTEGEADKAAADPDAPVEPEEEKDPEDELKDKLKDLFNG